MLSARARESFDLDEVFERVLVDIGQQKVSFSAGKAGVLWKLDRRNGQFLGYKEMVAQTIWERIDPKGVPSYRPDILEMGFDQTVNVCPSTAGGKNWAAMSYRSPPACWSCRSVSRAWTSPFARRSRVGTAPCDDSVDAEDQRSSRQARGLRRADDAGAVEAHAARGLFDWRGDDRWRIAIVVDIDRTVRAHDVRTGQVLWETRLGTSAQGFPVTYSIDGKPCVAVAAGLGGGSPSQRPGSGGAGDQDSTKRSGALRIYAAR